MEEYGISISRACKLMEIHRSYFYYTEKKDDTEVEEAIRAAAEFGDGFWKIYSRLRREGKGWNHKKVYRVYKAMHYEKRSRLKKRLPARVKNPLVMSFVGMLSFSSSLGPPHTWLKSTIWISFPTDNQPVHFQ